MQTPGDAPARTDRGRAAQHVDARETRRARERAEGFYRRHVPVAEVGVELAAAVQLEEAAAGVAGHLRGHRLDDRDFLGHRAHSLDARERLLHVVEDAEVEHDIERPERRKIHRREVGDDGLHSTPEHAVREVEPAPAGQVGTPEVRRVARLIRELAPARQSFQYCDRASMSTPHA